ncbi:unnamed protein product [Mytilus coruscus]|uniref:Ig-like domain-containing protein n=1 Tax=Mytilus coruscus TaxID=42192 RepID=A0A6J8DZT2_MYTCO|nr:unnamed protein product [Mytilus coruscus]
MQVVKPQMEYIVDLVNIVGLVASVILKLDYPILTPVQNTYNTNIGGGVTMKCTIDSSHHKVTAIMWTRENIRIYQDSKHVIADNAINQISGWTTLIIDNIQSSDNTNYYCMAENQDGWGTSSVITLNAHALHLPIVSPAQTTYVAIIGGVVKLVCTITSSDHTITGVFWTKTSANASPTLHTGLKYVIANTGTNQMRFTTLIINSVMSTDGANYFCSAQNQDGIASSSITLHTSAQTTTEGTTTLQQTTAVSVFRWAYIKDSNLTFEEIKEEMKEYLEELKSNLTVDKTTTTTAIRRKCLYVTTEHLQFQSRSNITFHNKINAFGVDSRIFLLTFYVCITTAIPTTDEGCAAIKGRCQNVRTAPCVGGNKFYELLCVGTDQFCCARETAKEKDCRAQGGSCEYNCVGSKPHSNICEGHMSCCIAFN